MTTHTPNERTAISGLVGFPEAARFLNIQQNTLHMLVYSKKITPTKRGKSLYFEQAELDRRKQLVQRTSLPVVFATFDSQKFFADIEALCSQRNIDWAEVQRTTGVTTSLAYLKESDSRISTMVLIAACFNLSLDAYVVRESEARP